MSEFKKFCRGAVATPRHVLARATPFRPRPGAPAEMAIVPTVLHYWGNNVYGDCVSAEEAYAKAAYSVQCGLSELVVPTSEVESWASQHGVLNGAGLTQVMDAMAQDGFVVGGVTYNDGPYTSVDYSNEAALQSAIAQGPVKIGIDANALPSGAGNQQGWYATGGTPGQFSNEDHCVSLTGYGSATYLFQQLGVPLPSGLPGTTAGYLLFTWSTIGFVDHAWIMSTCGEAWLRNPTTTGQAPTPTPTPTPTPRPCPGLQPVYDMLSAELAKHDGAATVNWRQLVALVIQILTVIEPLLGPPPAAARDRRMTEVMSLIRDLACAAGCEAKVMHALAECCH